MCKTQWRVEGEEVRLVTGDGGGTSASCPGGGRPGHL